jgi:iodotyrosine deiodinase
MPNLIPYTRDTYEADEMLMRSISFYQWMDTRRTCRDFSDKNIPVEVIQNIIRTAGTAPSGAHKQPWSFCVVSNPQLKKEIRIAAEQEEKESYENRMSEEWLKDLEPIGTDWHKPFLEIAPYLIIVFRKSYELLPGGQKGNTYYSQESIGLACGFLLTAIHNAGLIALTHTPSPMNFLTKLLNRPENERPFLLIPVGYPSEVCMVPKLERKSLHDILIEYK